MSSLGAPRTHLAAIVAKVMLVASLAAQEPSLPPGLAPAPTEAKQEPGLPPGLAPAETSQEPGLPPGLAPAPDQAKQEPGLPPGLAPTAPAPTSTEDGAAPDLLRELRLTGFLDLRAGARLRRDPFSRTASVAEARLRLETERPLGAFVLSAKGDLVLDALETSWTPDLESGRGFFDLREASAAVSPLPWLDLKLGRQVLTWGTGDMLFVNDLFPKDWVSFFVGRDEEYLKAPSDALRVGAFTGIVNVDLVATPRFDPDRFVRADRLSFFDPIAGRQVGRDLVREPQVPDDWFDDGELALRVYRNLDGVELAGYAYRGYWKSPAGFDPASGRPTFPELQVYGLSARTQLASGIANFELGYYDSRDDAGGDDAFVDNSQVRALLGYERDLPEVADALTVGVQYYLEAMLQHDDFVRTLPPGAPWRDELRHVVTLRVTKLLLEQRLRLSTFAYVSPSDHDVYLRAAASYTLDDQWSVTLGANVFAGEDDDTFFGQFDRNTNVYVAARLSF